MFSEKCTKRYHVKKGDVVEVLSGVWKNETGKIAAVLKKKDRVVLEIQGIAPGFIAQTMDTEIYDELFHVSTSTAFEFQKRLSTEQGVLVGISAGAAAAAATDIASRPEFAGKVIVAILPDTGERYLSMIS